MKNTYLILLLCATSALARNRKDVCAEYGSDGRILPHENCNQFYKCAESELVAFTCTSNLLYNIEQKSCDWPENVDCGARLIFEEKDTDENDLNDIESPLSICALETAQGKLIPNEFCNEYFICSCGSPLVLKCPLNLLYNPATKSCDLHENVECGNRIIPNDKPEGKPTEICAVEGSDGLLLAHENCNQFYICSFGAPVARICGPNLLFNPKELICDWVENVECGDRIIPEATTSQPESETSTEVPTTTAEPEIHNITGNPWEVCATDGSNSLLLPHENCNQFYICANGAPVTQSCPATLLYNPLEFACDWPENVQCGNRTIPEVTTTARPEAENDTSTTSRPAEVPSTTPPPSNSTTPAPEVDSITGNPWEVCAIDGSNSLLLPHEKCNRFYICVNGAPVTHTCPATLLYNPLELACDWPENVKCGNRTIPEVTTTTRPEAENVTSTTSRPAEVPSTTVRPPNSTTATPEDDNITGNPWEFCTLDGSNSILLPHKNCNQFYICVNGAPVSQTCPGTLLYNPLELACDWPENVKCGNRTISEVTTTARPEAENVTSTTSRPAEVPSTTVRPSNSTTATPEDDNITGNPWEVCALDGSNSILLPHENCNQFYICVNGAPVSQTCPGTLLYNSLELACDWPKNVKCGNRTIPEVTTTARPEAENVTSTTSRPTEVPSTTARPSNTTTSTPEDDNITGNPWEVCALDGSNSILLPHKNCNQFYICVNGAPVTQTCPGTLLYNSLELACDWPENVKCGNRTIPEVTTTARPEAENVTSTTSRPAEVSSTTTRPFNSTTPTPEDDNITGNPWEVCALDDSNSILLPHENCNQFYICVNGAPVSQTCPGSLLYNPLELACDWAENVECGDRTIPEITTTAPVEVPSTTAAPDAEDICALEGSHGVLLPNSVCNQYYICLFGRPVEQVCPPHLLFNPRELICDWPENVECGDRTL